MKVTSISRKALDGLTHALSRLEADDNTDMTDDEEERVRAADEWIRHVWHINEE